MKQTLWNITLASVITLIKEIIIPPKVTVWLLSAVICFSNKLFRSAQFLLRNVLRCSSPAPSGAVLWL